MESPHGESRVVKQLLKVLVREPFKISPNFLAKRSKLPDYSVCAIMENAYTPQAKAWAWLNGLDKRLDVFGEGRVWAVEKFALETLYYATNGSSWMFMVDRLDSPPMTRCQELFAMGRLLAHSIQTILVLLVAIYLTTQTHGSVNNINLLWHDVNGRIPPEISLLVSSLELAGPAA
jgi:hypothetical protein